MSQPASDRESAGVPWSRRGFWEPRRLPPAQQAWAACGNARLALPRRQTMQPRPTSPQRRPIRSIRSRPTKCAPRVEILRKAGKVGESTRFVSCSLVEPVKDVKVAAPFRLEFPRMALLVLLDNATGAAYEARVDLGASSVWDFQALPKGIHPPMMFDEFAECEAAVKRSPKFLEALAKRGLKDADLLMVEPWAAGHYGNEPAEDHGRRLARALCFVRTGPTDNGFARPLDGVVAVVDLNKMEVVRIEDQGAVPLPPESGNWGREFITPTADVPKPLSIVQPDGASYVVDGHLVRWQKWEFRVGFTPREGLVLYNVSFADEGQQRSILHRASICEMVVPYGDPTEKSYRKNGV